MQFFEETEVSYNSLYWPVMSNFIKIQLDGSLNETRESPGARTNRTSSQTYMQITSFLVVTPCSLIEIYRLSDKYTVSIIKIRGSAVG
jgi:hypothetical protein